MGGYVPFAGKVNVCVKEVGVVGLEKRSRKAE